MIANNDLGRRILEIVGGQSFCAKCQKPSDGKRSCPYQADPNNCECCDDCARECLYDI